MIKEEKLNMLLKSTLISLILFMIFLIAINCNLEYLRKDKVDKINAYEKIIDEYQNHDV